MRFCGRCGRCILRDTFVAMNLAKKNLLGRSATPFRLQLKSTDPGRCSAHPGGRPKSFRCRPLLWLLRRASRAVLFRDERVSTALSSFDLYSPSQLFPSPTHTTRLRPVFFVQARAGAAAPAAATAATAAGLQGESQLRTQCRQFFGG